MNPLPNPLSLSTAILVGMLLIGCSTADSGTHSTSSATSTSSNPTGSSTGKGSDSSAKGGNSLKPQDVFTKPKAFVKIPFEGEVIEVNVILTDIFPNKRAKDGIAALQVGDIPTAKVAFEDAVRENMDRHTHQFALAVCLEALGDYAEAKKRYAEANRIKSGDGHFDAQAGLKRIAARGQ